MAIYTGTETPLKTTAESVQRCNNCGSYEIYCEYCTMKLFKNTQSIICVDENKTIHAHINCYKNQTKN